jgi:hypothetical protein
VKDHILGVIDHEIIQLSSSVESDSNEASQSSIDNNESSNRLSTIDNASHIDRLKKHKDAILTCSLGSLVDPSNQIAQLYSSNVALYDILWDETLIRILFQKMTHEIVQEGHRKLPDVLKNVKVLWTSADHNRISNFLMKVTAELKKHSMIYMLQKPNIKKLVKYLTEQFPDLVLTAWEDKMLSYDGEIECEVS